MKTLLVVRHAHADWEQLPHGADFDRPLTARGQADARKVAETLRSRGIQPDYFIASPAARTTQTATIFADVFQWKNAIVFVPELYHAHPEVFLRVAQTLPEEKSIALLISHNPGITEFVNFCTKSRIDDLPTASLSHIQFSVSSWRAISYNNGTMHAFLSPRELA